ncbi:MAG: glycosyltransferase [Spirochaetaceae bacterium]|jgi:UDP:flavonoid glycosyltransferase YjiC (YdhE family)|nr:glycosyltransferase [Spirochaetaceae bacterium]
MKILLVTRGSQGDVYPYLQLAKELGAQSHEVTLNLPRVFEGQAKDAGLRYTLQGHDDIGSMMENELDTKDFLDWTRRVIGNQFKELIPLLGEHDILVASNTEFAAPSIAEYLKKPYIRTAYGPFIPSRTIPPPIFPWPTPHPILRPALLWGFLNAGLNLMVKKPLNRHRVALGMPPIQDQADHAPRNAFNYLMYSPSLGSVDPKWPYPWAIGGYIFNDQMPYNEESYGNFIKFIEKDDKKSLFFTLGSCKSNDHQRFAARLFALCRKHDCKLVIGSGWCKLGSALPHHEDLFLLEPVIPHHLVFPRCSAIIHHGGIGTTHSAARSGRPQMIQALFLDQWYWAEQTRKLGVGPGKIDLKRCTDGELEKNVLDLLNNESYQRDAALLGEKIRQEKGLENACHKITHLPWKPAGR